MKGQAGPPVGGDLGVDPATRVSVVIPTFNRRGLIERAVRSAVAQTLAPLEIIVVDDASSDGSGEEMRQLAERYPSLRPIPLDRNVGGGGARNAGIDAALGDVVAFLDVDDEWAPDHLRRMTDLLGARAMAVASARVLVLDGTPTTSSPQPFEPSSFSGVAAVASYMLTHHMAFQTSTLMLATPLAKAVRFDARLRRHQDWDFVIRLAKAGAVLLHGRSATVLYHAPTGTANVSRSRSLMPSLRFLARHKRDLPSQISHRFRVLEIETRRDAKSLPFHLLSAFLARRISWPEMLHYAVNLPRSRKRNK